MHIKSITPSVFAMQTAVLVTQYKAVAKDANSRVIGMDTSPGSAPYHPGDLSICFPFFVTVVMTICLPSLPFCCKSTRVWDPEGQGSPGDPRVHIGNPQSQHRTFHFIFVCQAMDIQGSGLRALETFSPSWTLTFLYSGLSTGGVLRLSDLSSSLCSVVEYLCGFVPVS